MRKKVSCSTFFELNQHISIKIKNFNIDINIDNIMRKIKIFERERG